MVNSVRAVTKELQEFENNIVNAEAKRNNLEYKIFTELKDKLADHSALIKQIASQIAQLDALRALTELALKNNYSRPLIDTSLDLEIINGRHPVVEEKLSYGQFVANDSKFLDSDESRIMILTGPNMSGKSTYMRQNALIIILAQIGSFVPADFARVGMVDRIFTRIGASDDLASGQSTFMVEMTETALILNGMSERSFLVFDEIGRGTSTYDGVAIAWSIVDHLAKTTKARTIFATHYHELANLSDIHSCVKNSQVLVVENHHANAKTTIEFLHKVAEGSADKSYGIEVARLAGLPNAVLEKAKAINNQLQYSRSTRLTPNRKVLVKDPGLDLDKLPLFEGVN